MKKKYEMLFVFSLFSLSSLLFSFVSGCGKDNEEKESKNKPILVQEKREEVEVLHQVQADSFDTDGGSVNCIKPKPPVPPTPPPVPPTPTPTPPPVPTPCPECPKCPTCPAPPPVTPCPTCPEIPPVTPCPEQKPCPCPDQKPCPCEKKPPCPEQKPCPEPKPPCDTCNNGTNVEGDPCY